MGRLSRIYSLYYMIFFLIFLIVFIFGVAVLASVVGDCKAICTLQTDPAGTEDTSNPDDLNIPGATCVKERGYCGDVDECTTAATVLDKNVRDAFNQECFYCDGATIKWPNFASAGREQWQPVGSCSDTSIPEGYGGVDRDGNSLCWNVPAEMSLRSAIAPVLWALSILYLLQALGNLVCSIGMRHFANKYSEDWKKLSKWENYTGVMVKLFPKINRLLNTVVFVLILVDINFIFVVRVCENAENEFGEKRFYPQAQTYLVFVLVVFLLTCIGGSIFRRVVPFETPFYQPRMRPSEDEAKWKRKCYEPTCYYFSLLGP